MSAGVAADRLPADDLEQRVHRLDVLRRRGDVVDAAPHEDGDAGDGRRRQDGQGDGDRRCALHRGRLRALRRPIGRAIPRCASGIAFRLADRARRRALRMLRKFMLRLRRAVRLLLPMLPALALAACGPRGASLDEGARAAPSPAPTSSADAG